MSTNLTSTCRGREGRTRCIKAGNKWENNPPDRSAHLKLETVEAVDVGRRGQERSVRRRGEFDQELRAGREHGRQLLATAAEFQDNWIPCVVAVVDGYVILG